MMYGMECLWMYHEHRARAVKRSDQLHCTAKRYLHLNVNVANANTEEEEVGLVHLTPTEVE